MNSEKVHVAEIVALRGGHRQRGRSGCAWGRASPGETVSRGRSGEQTELDLGDTVVGLDGE